MTRSRLVGPERQTDGLSADHAGASPGRATPSRRSLCACPCGPWPATPARRSEPGSSAPCQDAEHRHDGGQINRTRNPHPSPSPLHLDHAADALLWWAWRLNGRRQHKRDKGRIGRAFGGLLLLQTFAPPPKQKARGDPVPARHRRDRTRGPPRLVDNGALLPSRPGPARTGHHRMRESFRSRHEHDPGLSNRPVSISPAPKPYKAAQTGCLPWA